MNKGKVYIENLYNSLVFEKEKGRRSEMHLHDFFIDLFLTQRIHFSSLLCTIKLE